MIPKRIICTHTSQFTLEPKLRYCMNVMQEFHPGWEFLFFSDGDCRAFVEQYCPEYLALYDWYPRPVLKADLFRLLAVYHLGGFYLDTDFLVTRPFDPLCEENAVFPYEQVVSEHEFDIRYPYWLRTNEERHTLGNYGFGAAAGHAFLKALLDELVVRTETFEAENCNDLDILHSTGPDAVTSVYYRHPGKWPDLLLLDATYMGLGNYGYHLVTGVWRQDNYKL
ncbi:MAG: Mannosyltransferase [Akkermansiaceae bacterium]|nr:Mannosyltransferase [Akkermansiaceae bacterium]